MSLAVTALPIAVALHPFAVPLLNKAFPYLCPNMFNLAEGMLDLHHINWGSVLRSVIVLVASVTALSDTQDSQRQCQLERCSIPFEEGLMRCS